MIERFAHREEGRVVGCNFGLLNQSRGESVRFPRRGGT